jgi:hypothetical protein
MNARGGRSHSLPLPVIAFYCCCANAPTATLLSISTNRTRELLTA